MRTNYQTIVAIFLFQVSIQGYSEAQAQRTRSQKNQEDDLNNNRTLSPLAVLTSGKDDYLHRKRMEPDTNSWKHLAKVANEFLTSPWPYIIIETSLIYTRGINSDSAVRRVLNLEKKSGYNFHNFLQQIQDSNTRRRILGSVRESVEPIGGFICSFSVVQKFFPFIKPEGIADYLTNTVNRHVFHPFDSVYETMEKSKGNPSCAKFLFCHLNYKYRTENFVQRMIIQGETQRACSILSANETDFEPFDTLNEAAKLGATGHDCIIFFEDDTECTELMNKRVQGNGNRWQTNDRNNELRSSAA